MIGVYAIVHVPTNRAYVGSTNSMTRRFKEHRMSLRKGKHHSPYLQNMWNKHGESEFDFKTVTVCDSLDDAKSVEQLFLDCFYDDLMNCRSTAVGFDCGDRHPAKKKDWHMKSVMVRLTSDERKARHGHALGKKRNSESYVIGAKKRLADPEFVVRLSEACKGKREVVECPHCGLEGGGGNMRRYHFDKCRGKK